MQTDNIPKMKIFYKGRVCYNACVPGRGFMLYTTMVRRCNKVFMEFHIFFSKDFSFQLINKLLKVMEENNISLRDLFHISILLGN